MGRQRPISSTTQHTRTMNNSSVSNLRKPLVLLGAGLSLFAANAAFAQTPPATPSATASAAPTEEKTMNLETYTVTGSFLPVSSLVTASPVVVIENTSIGMSGSTDALGLMKKLTPFFAGNGNVGTELNNGA